MRHYKPERFCGSKDFYIVFTLNLFMFSSGYNGMLKQSSVRRHVTVCVCNLLMKNKT